MKSVTSINHFKSVVQIIYDIIKAHVGEIKLETKVCEVTTLSVLLPAYTQS